LGKVEEPLLPLFSGLFGTSTLLNSLLRKTTVPPQRIDAKLKLPRKWIKSAATGSLFGGLINIFPALGPAQAATLAGTVVRETSTKSYLIMVSAVNTASMLLALATLYSINRARNGSIEALDSLVGIDKSIIILFVASALAATAVVIFITLNSAKLVANFIDKLPYRILCLLVIASIIVAVALLSGTKGGLVLAIGTSIGIIAITSGISRSHAMSSLIIPIVVNKLIL
jgi:TctA family transporter